jgi:hypothetical protein
MSSLGEYMKFGFGVGLGGAAAFALVLVVAMVFFIPGFIIVIKQHKLPSEDRSTTLLVLGYILMGIGVIVGGGFGATAFLSTMADDM